jgi:gluconate 2-dehydrogenase
MKRPIVAVTRAVPREFLAKLSAMPWQLRLHDSVEPLGSGLADFLKDADAAILAPYDRIDSRLLERCALLRVVANTSAGHDNLDLLACAARRVMCTNAPDGVTTSTADFAIGLLITAARRIAEADELVRAGGWRASTYETFMAPAISGSTIGILGIGRIGQAIARRAAHGFGMRVLYWSRSRLAATTEAEIGCTYADKAQLLGESDHVVVTLPFSPETRHAIGAPEFASMRQGATFVHIGRGGVVDDAALAWALTSRHLGGAGLDVFEGEPRINDQLLRAPRLVLTPHIASATPASRFATLNQALENVRMALEGGQPLDLLNPQLSLS